MSLLNSLFAGVSGLRNHQMMMDVIGDNIANVNSLGFKNSRVTFSDTFSQYVRYGTNPTDNAGGTNSFQVGLGMKVSSVDRNWNQGTFERTGVMTDLAIQGPGMFILKNNGETFYSRAGNFIFDANGKLVNSQNGALVQGKMATLDGTIPPGNTYSDIIIDPNMRLAATPTTKATFAGNLSSSASITRTENYVQTGNLSTALNVGDSKTEQNTVYDPSGKAYTFATKYTKTANNTFDLTWDLKDSSGTVLNSSSSPIAMVFGANGTLQTMNGAAPAAIAVTNATNGLNFSFNPTAITQTSSSTTVSSLVDNNRTPTVINSSLTVFDSLGKSHTVAVKYTKSADNVWDWTASVPSTSGTLSAAKGSITFNPDGSISSMNPNPPVLNFTPSGGASPQNIELNFGSGLSGITQTSSGSVVSVLNQNGSAAASLSNLNIDQYGYIVGVFSNGETRKLAQIVMATFPNLDGLTNYGDSMYTVSANSGEAFIGVPGEETRSTLHAGALEQSNVDLSEEFTKMIVSQRGFQANARIISTADQLLQEITNLVR